MNSPKLVEFKTKDNLMLPGLLYDAENSNTVAIFLHGNGSSSIFYDNYQHEDLPTKLSENGISLLKFNNRGAHIIKKLNIVSNKIKKDRRNYGCAYEIIKECVFDIDGAIFYLKSLGYEKFYLIGVSTGANKICVYNHYKPKNEISKYVLQCGGDDIGIYHYILGTDDFFNLLKISNLKINEGLGEELVAELLKNGEMISYQSFYDLANPDGDYNCFPFSEVLRKAKLSKKPLFSYFKKITKNTLVIYGDQDEYAWGEVPKLVNYMKKLKPEFKYKIIKDADHGFNGKKKELAIDIAKFLNEK